jgi:hypothetical protein
LYDTCDKCPLPVYIDVTCDDRLERLIISGNPTQEMLEETRSKLTQEFAGLTGNTEMKIFAEEARNYFRKRNTISGIELSIRLIASGQYTEAVNFLNKNGVECFVPENDEQAKQLIEKLNLKLKNHLAKFKQVKARFEALQKKSEKPTRKYYNRLLATLSTCEIIKMQLDRNKLTLSEFAEYINILNEYQEQLKSIKNDRRKH